MGRRRRPGRPPAAWWRRGGETLFGAADADGHVGAVVGWRRDCLVKADVGDAAHLAHQFGHVDAAGDAGVGPDAEGRVVCDHLGEDVQDGLCGEGELVNVAGRRDLKTEGL